MRKTPPKSSLNAVALKESLWDTLQKVKTGKVTAGSGGAVAAQAREILRTIKTQISIFAASGKTVSQELVDFAKSE